MKGHLLMYGFERSYNDWIFHGDIFRGSGSHNDNLRDDMVIKINSGPSMIAMVREGRGIPDMDENTANDKPIISDFVGSHEDMPKYFKLLKEVETEFYEGFPKGITSL